MIKKPKINLCFSNISKISYIVDQVECFVAAFKQNGHQVSITDSFKDNALNVAVEYFNEDSISLIKDFCQKKNKKISVIMTEHIDFIDKNLYAYSVPIDQISKTHYSPNIEKRVIGLLKLIPHIQYIFTLGDFPKLLNFYDFYGKRPIIIPYPHINTISSNQSCESDLVFSGQKTEYRSDIIKQITNYPFTMIANNFRGEKILKRRERNRIMSSAKINLNIPQYKNWKYPSILRIILALSLGKATVSIEDHYGEAPKFYAKISPEDTKELSHYIEKYDFYYQKFLREYNEISSKMPFPENYLKIWGLFEGVIL